MLSLLSIWLVLSVPALMLGAVILSALVPPDEADVRGDWAFVAFWLGVLAIANVLLLAALAGPLRPADLILVLVAATAIGLAGERTRFRVRALTMRITRQCHSAWVGCVIAWLAAAVAAAMPVYLYDTGLYHYPSIGWLARYGDVPGLALIDFHFGLVTSWPTIAATVDHGVFSGRASSLLNGLAFALMASHVAIALARWRKGVDDDGDRFIACAGGSIGAYALAAGFVNSASPDLPGLFLPAVVAWIGFRLPRDHAPAVGLLLALLLFTVKLSAFPLIVATGLFVALHASPARLVGWGFAAALVMTPLILTGLVVSGCVLFPVEATCFDLPWSLPPQGASAIARIITAWARWAGPPPAHADFATWWALWGGRKSNLVLILLVCLSLAATFALRRPLRNDRRFAFASVLAALGIGYVLILAPDLRFAAGYLVVLPALWVASRRGEKAEKLQPRPSAAIATGAIAVLLTTAFAVNVVSARRASFDSAARPSLLSLLVAPAHFVWLRGHGEGGGGPDSAAYVDETNGHFSYRRPKSGDQCWDIPPPCSPFVLSPDIALRRPDEGLAAGFVRR